MDALVDSKDDAVLVYSQATEEFLCLSAIAIAHVDIDTPCININYTIDRQIKIA